MTTNATPRTAQSAVHTEVNARLLDVAPELLEALKQAAENFDAAIHGRRPVHNELEWAKRARAAILKAAVHDQGRASAMNTQHTPGPWRVCSGMVETARGIPVAHMDRAPGNGTQPVERDANARLIAAAPELLAALQRIATSDVECWHREHARITILALGVK